MVDDNFVFIGKKPLMSYVLATLRQINEGNKTVVIKARGKAIARAVDVAEIVRNQFLPSATVDDIVIKTEHLRSEDGRESRVSSIEIFMTRGEGPMAPVPPPRHERGPPTPTEPEKEWEDS